MPTRISQSLSLLLALLGGCRHEQSKQSNEQQRVAAPTSPTSPISKVAEARRLSLLPSSGNTPADALIAQVQKRAVDNPDKIDWWVALGRAWVRKARESTDPGYYLNAEACAQVALDIVPDSPMALDLRGMVLLNDHRFEEARALAQSVVEKSPQDPIAFGNLSDALLELGRFEEAADAAQTMVSLKPNLPSYSRAYYLRWLQGDIKGAKEVIRLAIDASGDARDPEPRAWALVQAAMLFWNEGDYEGADAGFQKALEGFADYPPALVGRARVAIGKGTKEDGQRAVALLEKAQKASPLVETAWLLGDARTLAGDERGAKEAYDLVSKQGRRGDPRTLSLFLSTKNRDIDEAVTLARDELRVRGDIYTQDVLAFALYRAGRLDEARSASEKAMRLGTRDAKLWFHAGAIAMAQGRSQEGRTLLKKALALNPKFDMSGAAEAKRLLANTPDAVAAKAR